MRFNTPLTLPIYWNTDESTSIKDLGLDVKSSQLETKKVDFYCIDVVLPCANDNEQYIESTIIVGGEEFYSPLSVMNIKLRINQHLKNAINGNDI